MSNTDFKKLIDDANEKMVTEYNPAIEKRSSTHQSLMKYSKQDFNEGAKLTSELLVKALDVIDKTLQQCGSLHKPIYFIWLRETRDEIRKALEKVK